VLVSARGDKVLTIYLMNGQLHSTAVTPTKTLRQVITRMAVSRNDLNLQTCRAVDMDGNELNLDKKLTDLGVSEVRIGSPMVANYLQLKPTYLRPHWSHRAYCQVAIS
jgi:hypothetical protein